VRTKLIESNKPEKYIHNVRNVDTSPQGLTIPTGSPLVLNLSSVPQPPTYTNSLPAGWEDGLQVVLPNTAGVNPTQLFFYGVATGPILVQQLGEAVVFGVCQAAVIRGTRSATTAPWPSGASAAVASNFLVIDVPNNAFATAASVSSVEATIILLDNFTSYSSSASSAGDTRTAFSQLARAFVRLM
jgi:hypothetical protein